MNFNQRLRQKMAEKGPQAAKRWEKRLEENALKFNSSENQHAEKTIKECKKEKNLMLSL